MKTTQTERRDKLGVSQLNVEVPSDMHRDLKLVAVAQGIPLNEIALEAFRQLLEEKREAIKLSFRTLCVRSAELASLILVAA